MNEHPLERNEAQATDLEQQPAAPRRLSDVKALGYLFIGSLVLFFALSAAESTLVQGLGVIPLISAVICGVILVIAWLFRMGKPQSGTDFDLARLRLERRNRYRVEFVLWAFAVPLGVVANQLLNLWGTVLAILPLVAFVMSIMRAVQLYYDSPKHRFKAATIEDEMRWLFGEDWSIMTGPSEYLFAQDRLRRRRLERWSFYIHLALLVPILVVGIAMGVTNSEFSWAFRETSVLVLGLLAVWVVFVTLPHAERVFPTRERLERRERRLGETLRLEQQRMHPEAAKEKAKRKRYAIGDDGELIEVELP